MNLENLLNNTDFSQESRNKEAIKAKLLNSIKCGKQKKYVKGGIMKKLRIRPKYAVAVAVILSIGIFIAACGENIIETIRQFTVGRYASFVVHTGKAQARSLDTEGGMYIFSYEAAREQEKGIVTYFDTIDDVKPYLAFNPLIPTFLPTGFALDRISLFNNENDRPLPLGSNMYLNVFYTNVDKTQQIYMQIRYMDAESAFIATGSYDMRYISINGHEGVIDGKNVSIEIDGIMYMIMADSAVDLVQDDVIRMASSLR